MDKGVEMLEVTIPAGDHAFIFIQPREQAFDLPSPAVTFQSPLILCLGFDAIALVRSDQLNALGSKTLIERITVVGAIPNKSSGSSHGEGLIEGSFDKGDFIGREAALRQRDQEPPHRLVTLVVDAADADASGDEPVLAGDRVVGFVTSGGYGHTVGASIALAYVEPPYATAGAELGVMILGDVRPARLSAEPLYDPTGARMRG